VISYITPRRYNAQRTLHWLTHGAQPGYWEVVKPIKARARRPRVAAAWLL
jgi:hypothetical protein